MEEGIQVLKLVTALLQDLEYTEAIRSYKSSKQKSIALGDLATKYIFNIFKPKTPQATMIELQLQDGEVIKDESRILKEVHSFYTQLHSTDPGFKDGQDKALKILLMYLKKTLTETPIQMIEKLPDQDEVHKILKEIANNKAPSINVSQQRS
jgi:hypothetical protein